MYQETSKGLLEFIEKSPTCYQVVANVQSQLEGFTELREEQPWTLQPGGSYYVTRNGSSIIAFRLPRQSAKGFQIAAAHSDSPLFKVKPNGEICVEKHYIKLNVETYGGALYAPWLDRPLSVAGRLVVQEQGKLVTKLVNVERDLLLIPSLAIHMNRQVNDGYSYNPQVDLSPLFAGGAAEGRFLSAVADAAGVSAQDILGGDLFVYNRMKGTIWGAEEEFISSRSLDDLQCAWALVQGLLCAQENGSRIPMCCIFDNEEVGSGTKQGAASTFLYDVLVRIFACLGGGVQELRSAISNSFMVSADNVHGVHPNHPEKADPTNRPYLNGGVVIKYNARQRYTTDGVSEAIFKSFCNRAEVPYQTYANRSDIPGGSTLGNLSNRRVSLNTVDVGLAQLAMHSPYETAGIKDTAYLVRGMKTFYESAVTAEGDGSYRIS